MATKTPKVSNTLEKKYAVEPPVLNNTPNTPEVVPANGMPRTTGLPAVYPNLPTPLGKAGVGLVGNEFVAKGARTTTDTPVALTQVAETPSMWESAKAGIAPIARDWGNRLVENIEFDADPSYTDTARQADIAAYSAIYGDLQERDIRRLNGANSQRHFQSIAESLVDAKRDDVARAAHPIVSGVTGFADADLPLMFIPYIGEAAGATKVAKATQLTLRAAAGAGLAAGVNTALGDNSNRDDFSKQMDSVLFGMSALLPMGKAKGAVVPVSSNLIETDATKIAEGVAPVKQYSGLTAPLGVSAIEQQSAAEMERIAAEIGAHADTVGTLGKTNILGVDVKMPISQPVEHGFDITNNKMWSKLQSAADEMMHYLKGDGTNPLSRVLAAPRTQGDNIPYATAATQAVLESKLVSTEAALDAAAKELYNTGRYPIVGRAKHMQSQYLVSQQFGEAMQRLDQTVVERLNDKIPTSTKDILAMVDSSTLPEPIKAAQRAYINSGFAEEALKRARDTGLLDHVDDIAKLHQRSTYMPVRHSFEKMHNLIQSGRVDAKMVHKYIGTQIIRMYPEMQVEGFTHGNKLTPRLSAEDLGRNFFANQEKLALGQSAVVSAGLTREQLETLLRSAGVSDDSIKHVANTIYETGGSEGTAAAKHLRKRLSWDWSMRMADSNGGTFGLSDLVDGNAYMNLTDYARTMSHRIGAAQYGIKSTADYETLKEAALKSLPEGTSIDEAKRFMDNVGARMFGHAVGENVPPTLRSLSTLSGMMLLANSGLYNLVDAVTMVGKLGLMRTLPQVRKGLANCINPMKQLTKNEAGDLEDILTGLLSIDGRWRHFTMRYADNFEVTGAGHRSIQHYGQSTKFLNASEYVKRMQIGMIGGVIVSAFKGAARGSAKDIKYLKDTLRFSDELTQAVTTQFKEHGHNIDMWDNVTRMNMEQKVFFEADNLAHTIRSGEIPSFMEHSSVGKVVFPFMSFMFAMQQKVLRNTFQRDGAAGVALVAAMQFPTAAMVGMVKNIRAGKEPDDNLAGASVNALSVSGIFGYPLDIILNGGMKTSSATLAPVSNALSLGQKIYNGNATTMDMVKNSPLGAATGILGVVQAMSED